MSIAEKLVKERRARLAAERLLEQKSRELYAANQRLAQHALVLSETVVEQRSGLALAHEEAQALKGRTIEMESDLERARTAAQLAQRRLWEALETIRDGFAVFDSEMRLIIANGAYVALFEGRCDLEAGQSYDYIVGMMARSGLVALDGRDADDWQHELISRIMAPEIEPITIRMVDGRSLRFIDRRGEAGDLVCITADITDVVQREIELEEARSKAEAANRAKSAFLANMSHEIRTPMNGVVGMAELLAETDLTDEQRLFADTIRTSGEALLAIINDVLDYSKAEAERLKLYPEPFDLERCLHEVMLLLQPKAREKGIVLIVDFDLFLPTRFIADPGRMRQILTNLIGNAVKFTHQGQVLARVVGIERAGGAFDLHITVEDTGIGIAAEHIDHIFGEFSQVEEQSSRAYEGTGLGLAITRQLVGLMGGEMWVDSEPNKGSCFGFRVTLQPAEPEHADGAVEPVNLSSALVLMDESAGREILLRQIESLGLRVSACRTPQDLVRALDGDRDLHVLFLDEHLPGIDGVTFAEKLREVGFLTPIILMSATPPLVPSHPGLLAAVIQTPVLRSDLARQLRAIAQPKPSVVAEPAPLASFVRPAARRMQVLAAEDNRTNQLVFSKMVRDCDMDLTLANNGREAVELWRSTRPDLIFMDISGLMYQAHQENSPFLNRFRLTLRHGKRPRSHRPPSRPYRRP